MRSRGQSLGILASLAGCLTIAASTLAQVANATSFTYQGELTDNGVLTSGVHDFNFTPFASATDVVPLGPTVCIDDVSVENGRFTVTLPIAVPNDRSLFLQVGVRSNSRLACTNATGFTTLSPRQEVKPTPNAVYAMAIREVSPAIRGALRLKENGELQIFDGTVWRVISESIATLPPTFTDSRTFSTPGTTTLTVPAGVTTMYFAAWGGSGAGGWRGPGVIDLPDSCSSDPIYAVAGGGGAPGRRVVGNFPVTPGETLTIVVGGGGNPFANADGQPGQTTFVRRGSTTILSVPGGGGGSRPNLTAPINSGGPASSCATSSGQPLAAGGAAAAAAQLFGSGNLLDLGGVQGNAGRAPSCYNAASPFGTPDERSCSAKPGAGRGGEDLTGTTPQFPASFTFPGPGPSGQGGSDTDLPTRGGDGRVVLFWI